MPRFPKGTREIFNPVISSDSKHSIGNSSSSSGLVSDYDPMKDMDRINDKFKTISTTSKGYFLLIPSYIIFIYGMHFLKACFSTCDFLEVIISLRILVRYHCVEIK